MVLVKMTLEEREDQEQEVPKYVLSAPQMTKGKESKLWGIWFRDERDGFSQLN